MNRGAIRDLARKRLGETTEAFWTNAELNSWINDACQDVAFRAKCLKDDALLTPSANIAEYTMSSVLPTAYSVTEVYHYGSAAMWNKLTATTRTSLDVEEPGWLAAVPGTPTKYWFDRELDTFYVYPAPSSSEVVSDGIKVYFTKKHVDISNDNDSPQLPQPIHLAVVDYVVAVGNDSRGWSDKANDAWQKYFAKINDYLTESKREKEDEDVIMKNYRNLR